MRRGLNVLSQSINLEDKKLTSLSEQAQRALEALAFDNNNKKRNRYQQKDAWRSVAMSHQPGNSYQPLAAQSHGGDTDPNETRRILGQQNVSHPNGQMSPQSHGGDSDPNEVRRQLGQHVPGQPNIQTGQQSSSQYNTQAYSTIQYSTRSSPNVSRTSSQQQAYQSTNQPHGPVQYQEPQPGRPQQSSAHYVSVSSQCIQRRGKELIQNSG